MMGMEFTDEQKVFVESGPSRIGHIYRKARFLAILTKGLVSRI